MGMITTLQDDECGSLKTIKMSTQEMSPTLNHSAIIKFHIIGTETTLIKRAGYPEHCLNTEAGNIYKTNVYISACLNGADIAEISNIHQKLSVLKEDDIIIHNTIGSIIHDAQGSIIHNAPSSIICDATDSIIHDATRRLPGGCMFSKVHISQLLGNLVFSEVCNHGSIIHDIIKKWLFKDILPSKVCTLSENKQTGSGLRDYTKKRNNVFLFYDNHINNCSVKLVILNREMTMSTINKND